MEWTSLGLNSHVIDVSKGNGVDSQILKLDTNKVKVHRIVGTISISAATGTGYVYLGVGRKNLVAYEWHNEGVIFHTNLWSKAANDFKSRDIDFYFGKVFARELHVYFEASANVGGQFSGRIFFENI